MDYSKKVAILKEKEKGYSLPLKTVGGIAQIEIDGEVTTLFLSLINFATLLSGEFVLYLVDENSKLFKFNLGVRPSSYTFSLADGSFERGFACGVGYYKDNVPLLVAFAETEGFDLSSSRFTKLIADFELKALSQKEEDYEKVNGYDDEAVATENYYELEEDIAKKIRLFKEQDEELQNSDGLFDFTGKKEKTEGANAPDLNEYEKESFNGANYSAEKPYYDTAKKELEEIFGKFPPYTELLKFFPDSTFVKINYSDSKYYIVGVIKEDQKEKYICYGVPGNFSDKAPKELAGYCSFVPLSIFDINGEGFWMMFQDAITGECIKK